MVNSGAFDSDVDRNEKGEFTQPRRIAESPQSASSVHVVSGSLCENDFTTQTADSLPPASQAIEPTATKTEYKCSMSDLLLRSRKMLPSQCDLEVTANIANNDVYYTHETSIVSEGYPTEIGKSEETLLAVEDVAKCNFNKVLNKDEKIKTKVSVCCSVPLEKVQNILKACRSSADGGDNTSFQNRKQISKKDMCLYCDRTFVTSNLKQKHVDRYHSLKYNRRLSTRRQVAKHSVTACLFCDKLNNVERSLRQLFEHLVSEHPRKYFGCLECETRFLNFQILENHNIEIHDGRKASTLEQSASDVIINEKREDILENNTLEKLEKFLGTKLESQDQSLKSKLDKLKTAEDKVNSSCNSTYLTNDPLLDSLNERDEKNTGLKVKNRCKSKRPNENRKKEEVKRKPQLPTLSVTLEPIKVFPPDKICVPNENNFFVKDKPKINWVKELRSKKVSVVSTKMGIKQCVRITRQQNKTLENVKNSKRKVRTTKNDHSNKTSINTKYLFQSHPYSTFDVSFRVKKITDHSIDNIKISSLTFDDVFDKAFFNRVKCNIQENLLNYLDGKLFKSVESENRISSFQKSSNLQIDEPSQNYGCKISANLISPVTTPVLTDAHFGEEIDSQIECGLKPSKKKGSTAVVNDEVHYKYFTRRKYQAVISENKQHRDLSKLDMWTQLIVKNRQQKIMCEQKTDKEILEYKRTDEYKIKMQVEELDRILDKRGPLEDLKEEAIRTVALEKLNGTAVDSNIESYFDVTLILNQLLNSVFTTDTSLDVTREDVDNKCTNFNNCSYSPEISQVGEEIPTMLNLRRISYCPNENTSQKLPNNEVDKTVMMEMTGEWARSRIYVCAACGIKMPNTKLLIDHKNLFHEHVWCQHYEFVGNQGELYRHLSIPGLGKVGEIESSGSKMWRRSDARVCSKCNKQFNCLGDLHRHVLECGGDWSWMLARKKYKYRPYGSRPRKRRRGLLKFLHTFRERKDQSREKGKVIKKFEGPRQKPSDADTIQRMLANLPAKRATRKIISMKDGLQRSIKNPKISKTNKNKSLKQQKIQANKAPQKSKDPVKNSKKSRRLLRSNSNILFENQMNFILPKYKKERKEAKNDTKSAIRRHSVRNISRVLSNKLVKANTPVAKSKITDAQKKILKTSKSVPYPHTSILNQNRNENNLLSVFNNSKKKTIEVQLANSLQLKNISSKKSLKTSVEKNTAIDFSLHGDPRKRKLLAKKGKIAANEMTKSTTLLHEVEPQNVESAVFISSCFNKKVNKDEYASPQPITQGEKSKVKFRSSKGTFIKKSVNSHSIKGESSVTANNSNQSTLDLIPKPLNFLKSVKKKTGNVNINNENNTSETLNVIEIGPNENRSRNKKTKYTFSLRKSKAQHEHKNIEASTHIACRRKTNMRSKPTVVVHKLNPASKKMKQMNAKKTITKIIQVDGSSQSKPSTRSKRFRKQLAHSEFLCGTNNKISHLPQTISDLNEVKIISENNTNADSPAIFPDSSNLPLSNGFTDTVNHLIINMSESNTECVANTDHSDDKVTKCSFSENKIEISSVQLSVEAQKAILVTNNLSSTHPTMKKKINKKQRGLNDCIAMLTNKLQDKSDSQLSFQNSEQTFLTPVIEELPNNLTLMDCNLFSKTDESSDSDKNGISPIDNCVDQVDVVDIHTSESYIDGKNCKKNKENFEFKSKLQQNSSIFTKTCITSNCHETPACFWEQLDKDVVDQINCKYTDKDEVIYENTLIYNCVSPSCHDTKHSDKETKNEPISEQKSIGPYISNADNIDTTKTINQLEFQKNENQSSELQYPLPNLIEDNSKTQDANITSKFKTTSGVTDLRQTNNEIGLFHDFSQNCDIDRAPKYQTQNYESKDLKFRKQKIKHKKKNLHTKFQNNRKSLRNRYGTDRNKQEKPELRKTIRNGSRNEFCNSIAEVNQSEVVEDYLPTTKIIEDLTENEKTIVLSTSEEFSNSGKENAIIDERMKLSKHRKMQKGTSKKKNNNVCETLVNYKGGGNDMFKQMDVNNSIENIAQLSNINEFIDSDDDVPLAEFVKKSTIYYKTNRKSDVKDSVESGSREKLLLITTDKTQKDVPLILEEEVINIISSAVNQEDCSQIHTIPNILSISKEEMVSKENYLTAEAKLNDINRYEHIAVTTELQTRKHISKKSSKSTINNKKNTGRKKRIKDINSESKNDVLANDLNTASYCRLFSDHHSLKENVIQLEKNGDNQDNESFSKMTVKSRNNSANSTNSVSHNIENHKNQENSKENVSAELDKTIGKISNNLKNEILLRLEETENSNGACSALTERDAKYKERGSSTADSLKIQSTEEDIAIENRISQEENVKNTEPFLEEEPSTSVAKLYDANSSISITSAKLKSRSRLKTIFNNKRNANVKKKIIPQNTSTLSNNFCDICNKTFTRSENLLKHKRTLTHIAKLSELEALQAAEKLKQESIIDENKKQTHAINESLEASIKERLNTEHVHDNVDVNVHDNVDVNVTTSEYDEYPKNTEISTFALPPSQDSLKLVDIISDVLSKPIDNEFVKPNNFSGLILQSDHETKRCKSLGERKCFDSDKLQLFTNPSSPTHNMDLNQKFVGSKLSNTADIIVEKQISLLENMIEDNRVNFKSSNRIFSSSNIPANEENSNQSSSSEFSLLSSSKQEEGNDITFTHNTNIITNLIKPTLDDDNLIHSTQYEEISEDSNSSHFQVEEQKSRKALNRDEELFLECCSLLKSSSDISDLCKKPAKSAQFLNNFGLKPLDEFEWLEQKQLPTKKNTDFEYISNNFISDDSHMNVSVSDNFYNDLSYSNSNMSNSNLNLKVLLDRNVNDQLFSQPPIFEDISTESEGSSAKSLGSCFKTISSAIVLNEQDVYDKIKMNDQLSPSVESAQIPEEHDNLNRNADEKREKVVLKFGDVKPQAETNKLDSQYITPSVTKTTRAPITDYAVPNRIKRSQNKKMLTKGAMKVFEGLKVSIPKDGIDMKEVLSCSPTSKRLQLEAEEENISVNKKSCSEKLIKQNVAFNKMINNSENIKNVGNSLGLKITKKKYLPSQEVSCKIKVNSMTENENKSHDIYDFEETQDIIDTFANSSNSLPIYRRFRNKLSDKSNDMGKNISPNKKKLCSKFHGNENKTDDEESHIFNDQINNKFVNDKEISSLDSLSSECPSKKIDMCKSLTKNKCMIMGRIFKNAVKSKIGDEIKNIPAIENAKIVENFVLNCQSIQSYPEIDKEHKLSEEEMNTLFDNLLNEEKSENITNKKNDEINESGSNTSLITKNVDHKSKHKINRCKKRHRANSSDFSDEEFSIKKFPKRNIGKKSSKNNECVINLEQELKECIGVASRKSQRKCTSGKQNVLVEYWSSDESNFETDHNVTSTNYTQNIAPKLGESTTIVSVDQNTENRSNNNITDNIRRENELYELSNDNQASSNVDSNILKKKTKEISHKQYRKLVNPHNGNKLLKSNKNGDSSTSSFEVLDSQTIASCRRKRTAVDTLYYWSSSSEDELQDVIEVKPLREQYEDEDRPLQHGWIVGDSPKKLVTMLAQAKGKKSDVECVKKNKKKRTGV